MRIFLILAATVFTLTALITIASAQGNTPPDPNRKIDFHIAGQPIGEALTALGSWIQPSRF